MEEKIVRWSAPEFEYHEKTHQWTWMVILAMIVLFVFALWKGNFLFAVFVVIAGILTIQWGKRQPLDMDFEIGPSGIGLGGNMPHPYHEFEGFAIHQLHHAEEGFSELVLRRKGKFSTFLKIMAPNREVQQIRHVVNHHLPEIEYEDSLVEHISRLLRF
ncbi:MAG: hypothetical protein AAB389_04450 [Patescibacteria group bacterium]